MVAPIYCVLSHPSDHLFSSISARKFFFFVVSFFFCSSSPNFLVWSCTPWPDKDGFGFGFGVSKYPFLEHGGWGFSVVSQPRPWTKISHWFCINWWTKTVDRGQRLSPYRFCIGLSSPTEVEVELAVWLAVFCCCCCFCYCGWS